MSGHIAFFIFFCVFQTSGLGLSQQSLVGPWLIIKGFCTAVFVQCHTVHHFLRTSIYGAVQSICGRKRGITHTGGSIAVPSRIQVLFGYGKFKGRKIFRHRFFVTFRFLTRFFRHSGCSKLDVSGHRVRSTGYNSLHVRRSGLPAPEEQIFFRCFAPGGVLNHVAFFIRLAFHVKYVLLGSLSICNGNLIVLQFLATAGKDHIAASISSGIVKGPLIAIRSLHGFCQLNGLRLLFCSVDSSWEFFVLLNGTNHPVVHIHCRAAADHGQVVIPADPQVIGLSCHIISAVSLLDFPYQTLGCNVPVSPGIRAAVLAVILGRLESLIIEITDVITALVAIEECKLQVYDCLIRKPCIDCIMLFICSQLLSRIHVHPVLHAVPTIGRTVLLDYIAPLRLPGLILPVENLPLPC